MVGLLLTVVDGIVLVWAFETFRSAKRVLGTRLDSLITWEPYKYIGNPQYSASTLMLLDFTLLLNSLYLLLFTFIEIATHHVFALLEERTLERLFGEKYLKYKRKVPRYIPRII
ncbi:MAG: hypothetical protein J7L38_04555 [Thermoproteales archaeon]|nr:hypothetical protein [Thermoproteales archaeon]